MAKIQSQFPVGSFYLRGGNNGKGTINIRYFIRGRYAKKSTGIEVDVKMWDNKGQKIKGSTNPRLNNLSNQKNLMLQEFKGVNEHFEGKRNDKIHFLFTLFSVLCEQS